MRAASHHETERTERERGIEREDSGHQSSEAKAGPRYEMT